MDKELLDDCLQRIAAGITATGTRLYRPQSVTLVYSASGWCARAEIVRRKARTPAEIYGSDCDTPEGAAADLLASLRFWLARSS